MKKDVFISHGRYEEYVSEFAEAAFKNDRERVDKFLMTEPEECLNDPHVLDALIISFNEEMFSYLLRRGVKPQYRDYYYVLSLRGEDYFRHLPENPEWTKKARAAIATGEITSGLLRGTLTPDELRKNLSLGATIKESDFHETDYTPIILSARYPALELVKIIISQGADPHFLNSKGKNIFRLILENDELLRAERREFVRYFRSRKISPVPELNWSEKIRFALGMCLSFFAGEA